jgi:hypothetical protein
MQNLRASYGYPRGRAETQALPLVAQSEVADHQLAPMNSH